MFESYFVENPKDRFSHSVAHITRIDRFKLVVVFVKDIKAFRIACGGQEGGRLS